MVIVNSEFARSTEEIFSTGSVEYKPLLPYCLILGTIRENVYPDALFVTVRLLTPATATGVAAKVIAVPSARIALTLLKVGSALPVWYLIILLTLIPPSFGVKFLPAILPVFPPLTTS